MKFYEIEYYKKMYDTIHFVILAIYAIYTLIVKRNRFENCFY